MALKSGVEGLRRLVFRSSFREAGSRIAPTIRTPKSKQIPVPRRKRIKPATKIMLPLHSEVAFPSSASAPFLLPLPFALALAFLVQPANLLSSCLSAFTDASERRDCST